jgi:hypothetical protein
MKKPTKIILKLLNFAIVFILFSCEKELYDDKIYQSKINVEKISLKDSKSTAKINSNLFKAVSKINSKKKNITGKIVYDSINNIYFDDEKGIKISKDDYESYTFKIIKENGKLENLLFTKNMNNEFDAYKVKYDFTEEEMKLLNSQDIKPSEIISLSESSDTNKMVYITFLVSACSGVPWDCGGSICGFYEVTFEMWIDEGGGGGGGGTGNSGGTEGGGGGGAGNSPSSNPYGDNSIGDSPEMPIMTVPVHGAPLVTSPCSKVKKQFIKYPSLRQSLLDLATTTSQNVENGIFIDNSATSTTQNPVQIIPSGSSGAVDINPNPTNPYLMIAHTHNSPAASTYSIFSFSDLNAVATLINNNHLDSNFVFYVITADGTRYAITIDDPQSFSDFFYHPLDHPGEEIDWNKANAYTKLVGDYYNNEPPLPAPLIQENGNDKQNDLKLFLSFIKEAQLGATVFKVSSDFNTFTKVSLSSNNNTIQYDDCN